MNGTKRGHTSIRLKTSGNHWHRPGGRSTAFSNTRRCASTTDGGTGERNWAWTRSRLLAIAITWKECVASQLLLSQLDLVQGRSTDAISRLEPLLDRPGLVELQVTEMLPTISSAYAVSGETLRAEQTIQQAIQRSRAIDAQLPLGDALLIRARLHTLAKRWDDAKEDLGEALQLAREMPAPYLEARALYEMGVMSHLQGVDENARDQLTAALEIFERLGAKPYIERTRQALESVLVSGATQPEPAA